MSNDLRRRPARTLTRLSLACAAALLLCASAAAASDPPAKRVQLRISGLVRTSENTRPSRATVQVLRPNSEELACGTCEVKVDSDSAYTLVVNLNPGRYRLRAFDGGLWEPDVKHHELKPDAPNRVDFTLPKPAVRAPLRGSVPRGAVGAAFAGAEVVIYLPGCETCELARTVVDKDGRFEFPEEVAAAEYRLVLESASLGPLPVTIEVERGIAFDLSLRSGGARELVATRALDFDSLPINGRRFSDFVTLTPDVNGLPGHPGHGAQINGNLGIMRNIMIDGTSNADATAIAPSRSLGGAGDPNEFATVTHGFSAEHGRSAGGHIGIVRSGTNETHGQFAYGVGNDALDARNFFSPPGFDDYRAQFGVFQLGGPIREDKSFYFVGYDLTRGVESPTYSPALTSQLPALNAQLTRLGLPPEDLRSRVEAFAADNPYARLDFNLTDWQTLRLRYDFRRDARRNQHPIQTGGTSSAPSAARDHALSGHAFDLNYLNSKARDLLVEVEYQYQGSKASATPVSPTQVSLLIPGLAALGRATNLEWGDVNRLDRHALSGRFSYRKGKHDVRWGATYEADLNRLDFSAFEPGRAVIPDLAALSAPRPAADLFQLGSGGRRAGYTVSALHLYAQDNYRVAPNLTLNFGLRQKFEFLPGERPAELNGLQPRAGLAWDVTNDGRTTVRANYGLFRGRYPQLPIGFEQLLGGGLRPSGAPAPRLVVSFTDDAAATEALARALAGAAPPGGPQLAVLFARDSRSPFIHHVTAGVERELLSRLTVSADYVFRRSYALLTSTNVNLPPPTLAGGATDFRDATRNPAFAQIYEYQTVGGGTYHGLALRAAMRQKAGVTLVADYVFSKSLDDVPQGSFEATPENVFDRRRERALSDTHVSHRLVVSGRWELPDLSDPSPATGRPNPLLRLLGRPSVAGRFEYDSPRFYNVVTGFDANHDGNALTDRPLGVGRNTFEGQSFAHLDLRLATVHAWGDVGSEKRLQWTLDIFNVFNRANFYAFDTVFGRRDLSGTDPSVVAGARGLPGFDFRHPLLPNGFGMATAAGTPRRLRIGARFMF